MGYMRPGNRLAIFTDNSNTVEMFYSMCTLPLYNPLFIYAVDLLISSQVKLRIYHIPGTKNTIADCISQWQIADAAALARGLTISTVIPPQVTLGATKK